ncbi:DUF4347 domain-containing protein, partial [Microcoleus sp. AR_TQ3_B6]|uniref:FG-GAP-like repeat-containing protein n=1 Tax=Microcoleus sp. AR_TQ3_B6 TaxID=3055284 RepID=UPI002FD3AFB0
MTPQKMASQLIFIDSNVEDYQSLIDGISPNAEVIILDKTLDGIEQITQRLAIEENIEAIHIISHGSPGAIQLGANTLNSSNIESFAPGLQQWRKALIPGADILLYGCNVAADVSVTTDIDYIRHISQRLKPLSISLSRLKATQDNLDNSLIESSFDDFRDRTRAKTAGGTGVNPAKPNQFLDRLSELTGADIAASANPTGNAARGGDWELEVQTGAIETPIPFNANTLKTYSGVLGFAPKVDFTTGSAPRSVSTGDINGDGKPDLAVANRGSNTTSILLNTTPTGSTTATFATKVDFYTGSQPWSVSIGNINSDGKPDVATVNAYGDTLSILFNTTTTGASTPTFAPKVDLTTGHYPESVGIGDFNGDGSPDVAVLNSYNYTTSIFVNTTATNTFTPVNFSTGSRPISVSIDDINRDGKLDLATANGNGNNTSILLNTTTTGATTPTFATKVNFSTGSDPYSVCMGDINSDGKPDLAVANLASNNVSILLNTTSTGSPTPTFGPTVNFTTGTSPGSVSIGDFNGDGKPDLAVANSGSNTASILLNTTVSNGINPSPTFDPKVDFPTGSGPISVSIGDFNSDGKPDLVVANANSNTASILLNTTPKVTAVTATTPDGSYGVGSTINLTVTFDAAVNVTGTPRLQLETGTTDSFANYASGSGGTVLTFNYVVQAPDTSADLQYLATNALTLNGGTIKDNLTVDAILTLPDTATANSLGGSKAIVIDTLAPTITSVTSTTANDSYNTTGNINVTVNFSEAVTLAGNMSVALDTGGTVTIASFSGTSAVGTYTPAAGQNSTALNSTGITLAVGATLRDAARNNATLTIPAGQSLADNKAIIVDTTVPTVALTPASATTVNGSFRVLATFSENVTGFDNTDITLANANVSNFVTVDGKTYTFDVTPNADGPVTVDVLGAKATDTAGNNNTPATQLVRNADVTRPTVALTSVSPTTINAPFLVTATFSENVTGFIESGINVTNGTVSGFTGSGTTYNFTVTPNADGNVTVNVPEAQARDSASNNNTAATQLTRTADFTPPTVALTSTSPTTINAPFLVTATFSENVTGFSSSGINVTNGMVSGFTGSGTTYNFTVTPNADGNVTVDVPEAQARDSASNNNTAATQLTRTADFTPPTVALTSTSPTTINAPFLVTATFSENVTGFSSSGINVTNGTVSGFTGSGTTYNFTVTPNADGNVTVDVPEATATDTASNNNTAATQLTRTADVTAPTASLGDL